jgi:hypothetical protein
MFGYENYKSDKTDLADGGRIATLYCSTFCILGI